MSLYDEIMAIPVPSLANEYYKDGMNNGLEMAAKLAKKYDAEIERLEGIIFSYNEYDVGN